MNSIEIVVVFINIFFLFFRKSERDRVWILFVIVLNNETTEHTIKTNTELQNHNVPHSIGMGDSVYLIFVKWIYYFIYIDVSHFYWYLTDCVRMVFISFNFLYL